MPHIVRNRQLLSWPSQPAVLRKAGAYATFDGLATLVVVSNGGLTVLHNNTSVNAGAISTAFKSSGKYYFEVKLETSITSSNFLGLMVSTWSGVFSAVVMSTSSTSVQMTSGALYSNGGNSGKTVGASAVGDVYGCAIDLNARLGWIRKNGGLWNGDAAANPATGTGGLTIAAGSFAPFVRFAATAGAVTDQMTGNFGQSAFVYAAPAGFGNWSI